MGSLKRITLRKARKAAKLTQAELAAAIGKPQSFISKLERGTKPDVTLTEGGRLGAVLGVDPFTLVFHSEASR